MIATGCTRGNGLVERINKIVITILFKLCAENPQQWCRYVERVQQCINNTLPRSTRVSPFRILTGLEIRTETHDDFQRLIVEFSLKQLDEERYSIREVAKENIFKVQDENRKIFNRKIVKVIRYNENEIVAIKRT